MTFVVVNVTILFAGIMPSVCVVWSRRRIGMEMPLRLATRGQDKKNKHKLRRGNKGSTD